LLAVDAVHHASFLVLAHAALEKVGFALQQQTATQRSGSQQGEAADKPE
jgi:hypothetical protein